MMKYAYSVLPAMISPADLYGSFLLPTVVYRNVHTPLSIVH